MTAKPTDINKIFASNAPATSIRDPDIANAGKYQLGWVNERPPYQTFNYAQNKVDRALSHINEYGVSEWDSETSYPLGGWARSTVDGNVYVSLTVSNQNNEPSASSSQWISLYSDVFSNFLTLDGVGSGLDADKVQGLDADFSSLLNSSGYQKLPGGLIIQWGLTTTNATTIFPIAFPVYCRVVVGNDYGTFSGNTFNPSTVSASSFTLLTAQTGRYIAIGH